VAPDGGGLTAGPPYLIHATVASMPRARPAAKCRVPAQRARDVVRRGITRAVGVDEGSGPTVKV
jgi:hypothetical protein